MSLSQHDLVIEMNELRSIINELTVRVENLELLNQPRIQSKSIESNTLTDKSIDLLYVDALESLETDAKRLISQAKIIPERLTVRKLKEKLFGMNCSKQPNTGNLFVCKQTTGPCEESNVLITKPVKTQSVLLRRYFSKSALIFIFLFYFPLIFIYLAF